MEFMENISIFTSKEMLFLDKAGFVISWFSNGGEHLEPLNN